MTVMLFMNDWGNHDMERTGRSADDFWHLPSAFHALYLQTLQMIPLEPTLAYDCPQSYSVDL